MLPFHYCFHPADHPEMLLFGAHLAEQFPNGNGSATGQIILCPFRAILEHILSKAPGADRQQLLSTLKIAAPHLHCLRKHYLLLFLLLLH